MRTAALVILLSSLWLGGGCDGEPDYVARTQPLACDPASRLVLRGYPENLFALLAGDCRAERSRNMRGPDFSSWIAGISTPTKDCSGANWFWTEESPDGAISAVNFCPAYCARLRERLLWELNQVVECERDAGVIMAGAPAAGAPVAGMPASGAGAPAPQP